MIQTTADTLVLPAALPLEEGGLLLNAKVAYEAYGRASPEAVVLVHDLHQSHRALADTETSPYKASGWARELVGAGKAISPLNDYVVSVNLIGSPFGSTSPATLDDETGHPLGPIFPPLTVLDMARALSGTLRSLGVKRVRTVVGLGMGGMVALRMAATFRDLVGGVIAVGAAKSLPDGLREQLSLSAQLLGSDPAYRGGHYDMGEGPKGTMKSLRLDFLRRAVMAPSAGGPQLEQRLDAEAEAFAQSFDANCYALLSGALGRADLTEALARIAARVLLVAAAGDGVAPPQRVRDTYHLLTAAGARAHFYELHEAEPQLLSAVASRLRGPLSEFLAAGQ